MSQAETREPDTTARILGARRAAEVRRKLVGFVFAVAAPFIAVGVGLLATARAGELVAGQHTLQHYARLVSLRLRDYSAELRLGLDVTAPLVRPTVAARDRNDSTLAALEGVFPASVVSISLYTPAGENLGHSGAHTDKTLRDILIVADRRYFVDALRQDGIAIGEPVIGRVMRTWTIAAARAARGTDGAVRYVQVMTTTVDRIQAMLREAGLPSELLVAVVDSGGNVVARSEDHANWAGRPAPSSLLPEGTPGVREMAVVPGTPWTVIVEAPRASLEGSLRGKVGGFVLLAMLLVGVAVVGAVMLARRLAPG